VVTSDDDLLLPLFHENRKQAIALLLQTRRELVQFFEYRDRPDADDLAQEAILRLLEKLRAGLVIEKTAADYLFGIAYHLVLEDVREQRRQPVLLEELPDLPDRCDGDVLETCIYVRQHLDRLSDIDSDIVFRYYTDNRERLRQDLALSANALCVRAHRLKGQLVKAILAEGSPTPRRRERNHPRNVTS
jgi:DNA-directed RNA polymerase specialized sigma24 family protein